MDARVEQIAELELANYAAAAAIAAVTPGVDVVLRDDVVLSRSTVLPTLDANHACLVRTAAERTDGLITEVADFFLGTGAHAAIYVSPACTPSDLHDRLLRRGFGRREEDEAWMVLEGVHEIDLPSPYPGIAVKPVTEHVVQLFAEVFLSAFDMPTAVAPLMATVLGPSMALSTVRHYLAWEQERAIGTCSLVRHGGFGILGSVAVVRDRRRSGTATNLVVHALTEALERGVDTVMLQTVADTPLERLLRISGFRTVFTRSCYILEDDISG